MNAKSIVHPAMDEYAKQQAVEFFKWNVQKFASFIEYVTTIRESRKSDEMEEALNKFEGATIEQRYKQFLIYQQQKS